MCLYSYPTPSIYRPGSLRKNTPSTTGMPLGSNGETTREIWRWTALWWGRPTWGSTDLGPQCFAFWFLPMPDMWPLMTVPGTYAVWRRLAQVEDPWILVLNTWRHLIRREVLLFVWWGVMDTWHPVCQHIATWPGVGPTGPTWCLVHISLIRALLYANDITISIVSTRPSQWCSPNGHLGLFMMMPYSYHQFTCS
jgi:hypothetical protein